MAAHITYLSEGALQRKFGRNLQDRDDRTFTFDADFQIESYLRYQGLSFVDRFDANSYLYVTRAMDYFDLADDHGGALASAFRGTRTRFCVASFTSDWLFPTIRRAADRACPERRRRPGLLRRDRDRQGPRRLPARHPGAFRHDARLHRRRGAREGHRMTLIRRAREPDHGGDADRRGQWRRRRPRTRLDYLKVRDMVAPGSRVLDVGCAEGELLALLQDTRGVDGRGIELSQTGVNAAVGRGLAVIQGDADSDLDNYPDDVFDYVVLSQTLQATRNPRLVLENMLRIGRRAIVSFPNFGHWRIRAQVLLGGRMPVTKNLPYEWYDTPNIHFCTIRDFVELARSVDAVIERAEALSLSGRPVQVQAPWWFWNLFGEQAVFLLRRR